MGNPLQSDLINVREETHPQKNTNKVPSSVEKKKKEKRKDAPSLLKGKGAALVSPRKP